MESSDTKMVSLICKSARFKAFYRAQRLIQEMLGSSGFIFKYAWIHWFTTLNIYIYVLCTPEGMTTSRLFVWTDQVVSVTENNN